MLVIVAVNWQEVQEDGWHNERWNAVFDPGSNGPVLRRHLAEEFGRLRAITQGPDGYLYVATSNRGTRGYPQLGDDRIVRLGFQ